MRRPTRKGRRGEDQPPRDPQLLQHEIARVLEVSGKPMHQTEIQARLKHSVQIWEVMQALHQRAEAFHKTDVPGTWTLTEDGRVLARTAPPQPAEASGQPAESAPFDVDEPAREPKRRVAVTERKAPVTRPAPARERSAGTEPSDPSGGPGRATVPSRTPVTQSPPPPRPPAPPTPLVRIEDYTSQVASMVERVREHGHVLETYLLQKTLTDGGFTVDHALLLALVDQCRELVRYPYGRGNLVGCRAWGQVGYREAAEQRWDVVRVRVKEVARGDRRESYDNESLQAIVELATEKGDPDTAEAARQLMG